VEEKVGRRRETCTFQNVKECDEGSGAERGSGVNDEDDGIWETFTLQGLRVGGREREKRLNWPLLA
jgi:hypothetical protein